MRTLPAHAITASLRPISTPWFRAALACVATLFLVATGAARASGPVLRIGVLAPEGAEEAQANWSALGTHLERALPEYRVAITTFDLPGLRSAIEHSRLDFFIANSGFYIDAEYSFGATRIATLESPAALSPGHGIASAVIVRADRADLRTFDNLRGQRVMAVSETAFGGFQVALREMRRHGFDPRGEAAALDFVGFPLTGIVDAVRRGDTDAGVIRACLLERLIAGGELAADAVRVINLQSGSDYPCARSTPLYPDWPFAALRATDHALSKRVAIALLSMPSGADRFSWTVPTDYQPVHELFRDLGIGPYAHPPTPPLRELLWTYRWWVALGVTLLLGWIAHTLRVEVLVTRRTGELRDALAARNRAEATAEEREQQLEHLARLGILGEMSSMLAHELNQPLSAIGNFARGMQLRIEGGRLEPDALLEGARGVEAQAERAAQVMDRIRAFSRKRDVTKAALDIRELIEQSVTLFLGMTTRGARVIIAPQSPAPCPVRVLGDALQLQQVMLNLLKNAFDATRDLAAERRSIVVRISRDADRARIEVRDRGAPIDANHAKRLFEPFFTTKPDGVGLGLAICQRTIEAHGGHIAARPRASGGLCVTILLPAIAVDEPEHAPSTLR